MPVNYTQTQKGACYRLRFNQDVDIDQYKNLARSLSWLSDCARYDARLSIETTYSPRPG